jgi:hypothetical protein
VVCHRTFVDQEGEASDERKRKVTVNALEAWRRDGWTEFDVGDGARCSKIEVGL